MRKKVSAIMLSMWIECHRFVIRMYRRRMGNLFESGESLSSPRMIDLTCRITTLGMKTFELLHMYDSRFC